MGAGNSITRMSSFAVIGLAWCCMTQDAAAAPGDLDPSFGTGGYIETPDAPSEIEVQSDDRIVAVAGTRISRFASDGAPDDSFASGLIPTVAADRVKFEGTQMAVDQEDRLLIALSGKTGGKLLRLQPGGALDKGFGSGGVVHLKLNRYGDPLALAVGSGDRIVVSSGSTAVVLTPAGKPDPTYTLEHLPGLFSLDDLSLAPDGKVVLMGSFRVGPHESRNQLVRVNPDGSVDRTFGADGTGRVDAYADTPARLTVGPDGSIYFTAFESETLIGNGGSFICYQAATALDPAGGLRFTIKLPCGTTPSRPVLDSAGRLLVAQADPLESLGGSFGVEPRHPFEEMGSVGAVRLLSAGGFDPAFGTSGRARSYPNACGGEPTDLALQSSGALLLGGPSVGLGCGGGVIARLTQADGAPDSDADGFTDESDPCPFIAGDPTSGCRVVGRRLRVRQTGSGQIRGALFGERSDCVRFNGQPLLIEESPGTGEAVARVQVDVAYDTSRFTLKRSLDPGRYLVTAPQSLRKGLWNCAKVTADLRVER